MHLNNESVSHCVLGMAGCNTDLVTLSNFLTTDGKQDQEVETGEGLNNNDNNSFNWRKDIIFIKNERKKKKKKNYNNTSSTNNGFLKTEKKTNNDNVSFSIEEGATKKTTEVPISTEYSRIGKTLVYHDSYKLLYDDTNIRVKIPSVSDDNEKWMGTLVLNRESGEVHEIENLKEYINNHIKLLSVKNRQIFLNNLHTLKYILNYNYMSVEKNKDEKYIELFQHHDNFLMHILKLNANGEVAKTTNENNDDASCVGDVPIIACQQLCRKEIEVERGETQGNGTRDFIADSLKENIPPCIYEKMKKVECCFEPGNNYKVVYPMNYRGSNLKETFVPFSNILFDSKMESGNLQYATKEKNKENYFLFLNNDTRMDEKKNQWFYFSASYVPDEYLEEIRKKGNDPNTTNLNGCANVKRKNIEEFINEINKNVYLNTNDTVRYSLDASDKFCVKNVNKLKTPFTVRFHIMNMSKPNFLYKEGHSPLVYSKWKNKLENTTWERSGYDVKYTRNAAERQFNIKKNCYESVNSHTYSMEFSYDFEYPYDTVYFSSSYPYTYSYLKQYLGNIKSLLEGNDTICYKQEVLCRTNCGFDCPILAITNYENRKRRTTSWMDKESEKENIKKNEKGNYFKNDKTNEKEKSNEQTTDEFMQDFPNILKKESFVESQKKKVITTSVKIPKGSRSQFTEKTETVTEEKIEKREKTIIWISARVHPGESNSSYAVHGFLSFLISESIYADILRENYIFIIIPMLNIDGVVLGNNRCCSNGFDLNRQWYKPISCLHSVIYAAKSLIKKINSSYKITLFCDFHGHSTKYNCFLFGNAGSNTFIKNKKLNHMFPKILAESVPWYSMEETRFKMEPESKGIARTICGKELNIVCSYTLEMSLIGVKVKKKLGFLENMKRDVFNDDNWKIRESIEETKNSSESRKKRKQSKCGTECGTPNVLEKEQKEKGHVLTEVKDDVDVNINGGNIQEGGENGDTKQTVVENKDKKEGEQTNSEDIMTKLNSEEQYNFYYYDENMYLWTGIGFGISLFKFMNFLNYYSSFIYELEEFKICSPNCSLTSSMNGLKTSTAEERNSTRKKRNSGSFIWKEKKCKTSGIYRNKVHWRKHSDSVEIPKKEGCIRASSMHEIGCTKLKVKTMKGNSESAKKCENETDKNELGDSKKCGSTMKENKSDKSNSNNNSSSSSNNNNNIKSIHNGSNNSKSIHNDNVNNERKYSESKHNEEKHVEGKPHEIKKTEEIQEENKNCKIKIVEMKDGKSKEDGSNQQMVEPALINNLSENECSIKKKKTSSSMINPIRNREKRDLFKLKVNTTQHMSNVNNGKKKYTCTTKLLRKCLSVDSFTEGLMRSRSLIESDITSYKKGNKINGIKNNTYNRWHSPKVEKKYGNTLSSEGGLKGNSKRGTSNKKGSTNNDSRKKEKEIEERKSRQEKKKKEGKEKAGKIALDYNIMKGVLFQLNGENFSKGKNITKEKKRGGRKIDVLKHNKEKCRNMPKTASNKMKVVRSNNVQCKLLKTPKNKENVQGNMEEKYNVSQSGCESVKNISHNDNSIRNDSINSSNLSTNTTTSLNTTSISTENCSSISSSISANKTEEGDIPNEKKLSKIEKTLSLLPFSSGKKVKSIAECKKWKKKKMNKSKKSKNKSRSTHGSRKYPLIKLKGKNGKERKGISSVKIKDSFAFYNKYKLDYTENGLKFRLRPLLKRNAKSVLTKRDNKLKTKLKKPKEKKKIFTPLLYKWKWRQDIEANGGGEEHKTDINSRHKNRHLEKYIVGDVINFSRKKIRLRIPNDKKNIKTTKGGSHKRESSKDEVCNGKGKEKKIKNGKIKK